MVGSLTCFWLRVVPRSLAWRSHLRRVCQTDRPREMGAASRRRREECPGSAGTSAPDAIGTRGSWSIPVESTGACVFHAFHASHLAAQSQRISYPIQLACTDEQVNMLLKRHLHDVTGACVVCWHNVSSQWRTSLRHLIGCPYHPSSRAATGSAHTRCRIR